MEVDTGGPRILVKCYIDLWDYNQDIHKAKVFSETQSGAAPCVILEMALVN